jgi:Arylsulfotransferase (ASST)
VAWIRNRPVGLTYRDSSFAFSGYTLLASARGHHALLLDDDGQVVHTWFHPDGIQHVRFLEDGNLLVHTLPPDDADGAELIGGSAGALVELDWNSGVVWEYRDRFLHHDYQRLPNGNHLVTAWDKLPADLEPRIAGGHEHIDDPAWMWADVIKEVAADGTIVSTWRSWEHLAFDEHVICPLESHKEWTHCNSLEFTPDGKWLLSFRLTSTIAIVDPVSGDVEWSWGRDLLSHQHHATWLDNGNILLFDNGCHRRRAPSFSQIVELDPTSEEIVWRYHGETIVAFFSFMVSGCQRLPNGNTLVTEGASGRLFEVTAAHDVVWEYVSPWILPSNFGPTPVIFRAYKYGADDRRFLGRDLSPQRYERLNERIAAGSVLGAEDDREPLNA